MIEPGSAQHNALISPSKVATILGISRWDSPYALWHRMRGDIPSQPASDIFNVGHAFEAALAELWRIENPGWRLSRGEVQRRGCADGFDWVCTVDGVASRGRARHVVEYKTARDLSAWGDDFSGDVPADYAAQVIAQMTLMEMVNRPAHLLVMGPFFRHHTYRIDYDQAVADMIVDRCREWWWSLESGTPPALDDTVATYECVRALHPEIDSGATAEIEPMIAAAYIETVGRARDEERNLRAFKTQILDAMGRAETATCNGEVVAKRVAHKSGSVWLKAVGGTG